MGVNINRKRVCDANDVRQLDFADVSKACGDDIFCDVSSHIACGPVNFGGVFAAKATSTVSAASAVSINDDFSACDAAITFWAAYYESACFVDVDI